MAAPQNNKKRRMSAKPICRYGEECYRKNPIHLEEYSHPHCKRYLHENIISSEQILHFSGIDLKRWLR